MRIIATNTLRAFWTAHPETEQPLRAWIDEVRKAHWQNMAEIKMHYRSASILKNRRVVFNIKGNHYRLVTAVAFGQALVFIKFIGTHAEYDHIDANTVEPE